MEFRVTISVCQTLRGKRYALAYLKTHPRINIRIRNPPNTLKDLKTLSEENIKNSQKWECEAYMISICSEARQRKILSAKEYPFLLCSISDKMVWETAPCMVCLPHQPRLLFEWESAEITASVSEATVETTHLSWYRGRGTLGSSDQDDSRGTKVTEPLCILISFWKLWKLRSAWFGLKLSRSRCVSEAPCGGWWDSWPDTSDIPGSSRPKCRRPSTETWAHTGCWQPGAQTPCSCSWALRNGCWPVSEP